MADIEERKALLGAHLETLTGVPAIQYENAKFDIPDGIYLKVFFNWQRPMRITHAGGHIERGTMQINVMGPILEHERDVMAQALLIQAHFTIDQLFAGTGETTRVRSLPHIGGGYKGTARWIRPVMVDLETLPG